MVLTAMMVWGIVVVLAAPDKVHVGAYDRPTAPDLTAYAAEEVGIVRVVCRLGKNSSVGTGIVVDATGTVVTAQHVADSCLSVDVTVPQSGTTYRATVLGYDRESDVAMLRLDTDERLAAAAIGDSSLVAVDDKVVARGYAPRLGPAPTRREGSVKELAVRELVDGAWQRRLIRTTIGLEDGDSGGPLFDRAGKVVGLNAASFDGGGRSFHVPINDVLAIVAQVRSGVSTDAVHVGPPAILGIGIDADVYGVERPAFGVRIREIEPGKPAAAIGLMTGDVIVAAAGRPVSAWPQLLSTLDRQRPGEPLELTWIDRSLASRSGVVTLAAGPDGRSR